MHAAAIQSPVYYYHYGYKGTISLSAIFGQTESFGEYFNGTSAAAKVDWLSEKSPAYI